MMCFTRKSDGGCAELCCDLVPEFLLCTRCKGRASENAISFDLYSIHNKARRQNQSSNTASVFTTSLDFGWEVETKIHIHSNSAP